MSWFSFVATDFCSMSQGGQAPEVTGSPTEKAILSWGLQVWIHSRSSLRLDYFFLLLSNHDLYIQQLGMKFSETRSKSSILQVSPFNSDKKRGGVAVQVIIRFFCSGDNFLILSA
jgi:P-type Ca2+ transporter type 2C